MPAPSDRSRWAVPTFLLLSFGLAWAIELGPVRRLGYGTLAGTLFLAVVMLTPGLAAFVVRHLFEGGDFSDAGLRWGQGRYYLWAWLTPLGWLLVANALSVAVGLAVWDPNLSELVAQLRQHNVQLTPEKLAQGRWLIPLAVLTWGSFINSFFAFGEELGWRGYLQMRWQERFGVSRGFLLVGLVWGLWHAPVILLGHNYPKHPRLGVLLMVGFCILLSFFFGWLRLRSGSVFVPSLAHGALNAQVAGGAVFLKNYDTTIATPLGVVGMAVFAVFLFVLWRWLPLSPAAESSAGKRW